MEGRRRARQVSLNKVLSVDARSFWVQEVTVPTTTKDFSKSVVNIGVA